MFPLLFATNLCVLVLLALAPQLAAARDFNTGAVPAWVQRVTVDSAGMMPAAELSDGVYYLLSDEQVRFVGGERQAFYHYASRVVSDKGLDEAASLSIGFDPAYQTMTLHAINVIRNGRVIPKLAKATVRVLQREPELEARVFDGRKSANVFLEDVRVGDIVEYAYSVRGSNPVFGGRHFGGLVLGWGVPVGRTFGRLLVQHGKSLTLHHHKTSVRPVERKLGDYREFVWDVRNVAPLHVDGETPGWYDPYPWVQWTEFDDWGDVARWAEPLYRTPATLSPALQSVVKQLAMGTTPEERAVAALQFVQREIRYLGVEIGVGSHAPSAPELVLQRRFGDCKDKTLLTVTLLRALGIEARPALVNTSSLRGVSEQPPNPGAFNHVIVQARIGDEVYWFDPTRAPQSGTLKNIVQPDFGQSLLIDAGTRELSSMDTKGAGRLSTRRITAEFNARGGFDKPMVYTVTTHAEGAAAELLRNVLAANTRDETQKRYLNYYAHYYPGIEVAAPFEVVDDNKNNRVSVIEHYQIKDFWTRSEEQKSREATSYVPDLEDVLRKPHSTLRSDPLVLEHPVDISVSTVWLLPEAWSLDAVDETIDDPAFTFEHRLSLEENKRKVVETDHFVSRADFVAAADAPRYAANLEKARQALGITLTKSDPVTGEQAASAHGTLERINWSIAMLTLTLLAVLIWLAMKVYRYDPAPSPEVKNPALRGIGGWLLLVALGIVIQPLKIIKDVIDLIPAYAADTWMQLTTVGQETYHALWAPFLLFELTANLALIVFSILLMILFFQKRSSVSRVYLTFQGSALLVTVIDQLIGSLIPAVSEESSGSDVVAVIRQAVSVAIWCSYFLLSKRVQATFVERLKASGKGEAPDYSNVPEEVAEREG